MFNIIKRVTITIAQPSLARSRAKSFSNVDVTSASNRLSEFLINEDVYLGGSSVGKGLRQAAQYHLQKRVAKPDFYNLPGAANLEPGVDRAPLENSFYVIDLGLLVSQVYQWRRYFPRVEPFCKSDFALYNTKMNTVTDMSTCKIVSSHTNSIFIALQML